MEDSTASNTASAKYLPITSFFLHKEALAVSLYSTEVFLLQPDEDSATAKDH